MVTGSIEHKIYNLVHEALPRVTRCVYEEQRLQIKREKLISELTELFLSSQPHSKQS